MGNDPILRLSQSRVLPLHYNHHKIGGDLLSPICPYPAVPFRFTGKFQVYLVRPFGPCRTILKNWSGIRESNSCPNLGKVPFYHLTNPALNSYFNQFLFCQNTLQAICTERSCWSIWLNHWSHVTSSFDITDCLLNNTRRTVDIVFV